VVGDEVSEPIEIRHMRVVTEDVDGWRTVLHLAVVK